MKGARATVRLLIYDTVRTPLATSIAHMGRPAHKLISSRRPSCSGAWNYAISPPLRVYAAGEFATITNRREHIDGGLRRMRMIGSHIEFSMRQVCHSLLPGCTWTSATRS